jgi:hypothetical protein
MDYIFEEEAFNMEQYVLHFYDEYSGHHKLFTTPDKDGPTTNKHLQYYLLWVERRFSLRVSILHTDGETSLDKKSFSRMGLTIENSAPATQAQNGKAERAGKTLTRIARCLRTDSRLPTRLWPQFYAHAATLSNVLPIASKGWRSPMQTLMEYTKGLRPPHSLPDLSGLKAFGCVAYPMIKGIPRLQKMLPRARLGIFVGMHNDSTNDYLIWIPSTSKIEIRRDVIFNENKRYDPSEPDLYALLKQANRIPAQEPSVPDIPDFNPYAIPGDLTGDWFPERMDLPPGSGSSATTRPAGPSGTQGSKHLDQQQVDQQLFNEIRGHLPSPEETPPPAPAQHLHGTSQASTDSFEHLSRDSSPPGGVQAAESNASQQSSRTLEWEDEAESQEELSAGLESDNTIGDEHSAQPESRQSQPPASAPASKPPKLTKQQREQLEIEQARKQKRADREAKAIARAARIEKRNQQAHLAAVLHGEEGAPWAFLSATLKSIDLSHMRYHASQLPDLPQHWHQVKGHSLEKHILEASHIELRKIMANGTFRKEVRIKGNFMKALPLKWVWTYKLDEDGYLIKVKARLVVRGDLEPRQSSEDIRAATLAAKVFRAMVALAAVFDLEMEQWDAVNAFTNALITGQPVYVAYPPGFANSGYCLPLRRALYGLRRSPKLWFDDLSATFKRFGLRPAGDEDCLYCNEWLAVIFYVDDIIFFYHKRNKARWDDFSRRLRSAYEFRISPQVQWFLGVRIVRDRLLRKIWLCLDSYGEKTVRKFHLQNARQHETPLPASTVLDDYKLPGGDKATAAEIHGFQSRVGSIQYPAYIARPDMSFAASKLAQYSVNPSHEHTKLANRAVTYLGKTRFLALQYGPTTPATGPSSIELEVTSDAAFADNADRKSTGGYLIKLFGGPIDWKSGKQPTVSTSTTEAELNALELVAREVQYWQRIFRDISLVLGHQISIGCDNMQTVRLVTSTAPRLVTRLRHVDIKQHWLRQEIQAGRLRVHYVPTAQMPADGFTKALPAQRHAIFLKQLGMIDIKPRIDPQATNSATFESDESDSDWEPLKVPGPGT